MFIDVWLLHSTLISWIYNINFLFFLWPWKGPFKSKCPLDSFLEISPSGGDPPCTMPLEKRRSLGRIPRETRRLLQGGHAHDWMPRHTTRCGKRRSWASSSSLLSRSHWRPSPSPLRRRHPQLSLCPPPEAAAAVAMDEDVLPFVAQRQISWKTFYGMKLQAQMCCLISAAGEISSAPIGQLLIRLFGSELTLSHSPAEGDE